MALPAEPADSKFTVFIRLPFPRGDFVDPPPVEWDAAKDQALWDILSRPSKDDVDWNALADSFAVTQQFLLQQAAWLYDRQLTQVRAQMRKVGTAQSTSPSPMLGSASGSAALGQPGKGAAPRVPSRLATQQRETPSPRPAPRRTSSNATINQLRIQREQSRNVTPTAELKESKTEGVNQRTSEPRREPVPPPAPKSPTLDEEDLSSTSESESEAEDDDIGNRKNPLFKRPGKFSIHKPGLRDDEEDEEESPAFLPLRDGAEHRARDSSRQDLNATLRLNSGSPGARRRPAEHSQTPRNPMTTESSTSSASSGVPISRPPTEDSRRTSQVAGPLSPRRMAELARSSPRRSTGSGRETSDGTPSMGSSFSDIDEASVTESALQSAFLSNMQQGGMGSRMSTISQLRSRFL